MERKNKTKLIVCLSLFLVICTGLLISLAFSDKIERAFGMKPSGTGALAEWDFKIDVIDVGQGAACLLWMPGGEKVLIDAGPNSGEESLVRYLKKQKIQQIDYFVLTHSDNDHTGGADAIFENFEVKNIYRPFILVEHQDFPDCDPLLYYKNKPEFSEEVMVVGVKEYAECVDLMYEETYTQEGVTKQSTVYIIEDGAQNGMLSFGAATLRFWWPKVISGSEDLVNEPTQENLNRNITLGKPTEKQSNTNNYSPIMTISYLTVNMVITGDAGNAVEKAVMKDLDETSKGLFGNVDIYIAGHHGSTSSSCEEFLNLLMPKTVVVQCGDSKYHPHPDFLERVQNTWKNAVKTGTILTTKQNGDITFYFDADDNQKIVAQAVDYAGESSAVIQKWWQVVVTGIAVSAVFLLLPLVPKRKRK